MRRRIGRWALASVFFSALFFVAVGARCVENTSVRVDSTGRTHIYGDIFNDTNIQGSQLLLHGRLLNADGSIIAEQDSFICPPNLAPHGQSMFDIQFNQPNLPLASSYDVHATGGTASDTPLPDARIAITSTRAYVDAGTPLLRIDVQNNSGKEYFNLNGCVAGYDASGVVRSARSVRLHNQTESGTPTPGQGLGAKPDYIVLHLPDAPANVTSLRGWFWIDDGTGKQIYQPVVTGLVPLTR